jgi:hypothetical protein
MDKLREEQRRRHEELYGIPTSGVPGEESDEEADLIPNSELIHDTGDSSADCEDMLTADEQLFDGGEDLI